MGLGARHGCFLPAMHEIRAKKNKTLSKHAGADANVIDNGVLFHEVRRIDGICMP